jgi:hypothetical protein
MSGVRRPAPALRPKAATGGTAARPKHAPRPAGGRAPGGRGAATRAWLARSWRVALLVGLVMLGLPLAHAVLGEVAALLGATTLFGFLLGRWSTPRR